MRISISPERRVKGSPYAACERTAPFHGKRDLTFFKSAKDLAARGEALADGDAVDDIVRSDAFLKLRRDVDIREQAAAVVPVEKFRYVRGRLDPRVGIADRAEYTPGIGEIPPHITARGARRGISHAPSPRFPCRNFRIVRSCRCGGMFRPRSVRRALPRREADSQIRARKRGTR